MAQPLRNLTTSRGAAAESPPPVRGRDRERGGQPPRRQPIVSSPYRNLMLSSSTSLLLADVGLKLIRLPTRA